jgi:hypothetical protein
MLLSMHCSTVTLWHTGKELAGVDELSEEMQFQLSFDEIS